MIIHQPKNTLPRIESVYLFVSVDPEDGNEGVVAAPMGDLGMVPLIAADEARLESITAIARALAVRTDKIRLIKLTKREEMGFIE